MPHLLIFQDAWEPERFELPDKASVTIGFTGEYDVAFDVDPVERADRGLEAASLRLERDSNGWSLGDATVPSVISVNGNPLPARHPLRHEDVISVHEFAISYEDRDETRNRELEWKIASRPGDPAPIAVWADWLQEQRDPLGEQLAAAARGNAPVQAGCGLRDTHGHRAELGFRDGLLDSVVLRAVGVPQTVRALLSRIFSLRAARFLRTLRVDVCGMRGRETLVEAELNELVRRLPPSLRVLDLGYSLEADAPLILSGQQQANLPVLRQSVVFFAARRALLNDGNAFREVTDRSSIDVPPGGEATVVENARRIAYTAPHQLSFERINGAWLMHVGKELVGRVELNGRPTQTTGLLRNDEIVIDNRRFTFVLE